MFITIDTELSESRHRRGMPIQANLARSIYGEVAGGPFGIGWQMDRLEAYGLRAVFFVDPLPALVVGAHFLGDLVGTILARGHEVQLHLHTEWIALADTAPTERRSGRLLRDFSGHDQERLVEHGAMLLETAGAPRPIAFRAGNYGASDETLSALARQGFLWDSSFNAYYRGGACRIALPDDSNAPVKRAGIVEVPVSGINDRPGRFRPAQICSLSQWEMCAALDHAAMHGQPTFVIVSHGFEMLSRDRSRPNRAVIARFERLCRHVAAHPALRSVGFRDLDATSIATAATVPMLTSTPWRTAQRQFAQACATLLYENVRSYPDLINHAA